ncbi:MAG: YfcE family phosphodiesterase [Planctomycetaceae bacterium]
MRIGIFADAHDHVDNVRRAVAEFNRAGCELVVFAGDFVTPLVVPPLRRLKCPLLACFGDADGNKIGIQGGMRIVGTLAEPPFGFKTADGVKVLVSHVLEDLRGHLDDCDVVISAHTHKPSIKRDSAGRIFLNPGEAGGWMFRKPSILILETDPLDAHLISLPEPEPVPTIDD